MAMKQRRGTAVEWSTANPVLADGEIGFERDTNKIKVGNGTAAWNALQYLVYDLDTDLAAVYQAAAYEPPITEG